jgi:hypothetical protein
MNPIAVNTVAIREDPSQYLIRYGIEKDRFAQVLSSVTSRSVLLFGVARDETRKRAGTEPPCCLIAVIPLTASVDPDQTAATFEDNDLVLRLVKSGDRQSEEPRMPITECGQLRLIRPFVQGTTFERMIQYGKTEYDQTRRSSERVLRRSGRPQPPSR